MAPQMCSTDTQLFLLDRYDTIFGICNHDLADPSKTLLHVAMHAAEDFTSGSLLYERLDQFADLQVGKFFNISLTEFLELPSDVCTHLLEKSASMQKTEGTLAGNMLDQLNKQ